MILNNFCNYKRDSIKKKFCVLKVLWFPNNIRDLKNLVLVFLVMYPKFIYFYKTKQKNIQKRF